MTTPKAILGAFGVTLAVQASQPVPVTGFFADPVVAFVFRVISIVLSLALSGTIIVACVKMIAYFGAAGETQRNLGEAIRSGKAEFHDFRVEIREGIDAIRSMLQVHDNKIAVLETRQSDHERRLGDADRRHSSGRREANHHDDR
jgi:hypothetical protein